MHKPFFIVLFIFSTAFISCSQEDFNQADTRVALSPITSFMHKQVTSDSIRKGHVISSPGLYSVTTSHVKIESTDTPTNSHTVGDGAPETRGLIAITSSNVILDLGGGVISTDKSSHVAITIGDGLHGIIIRNGMIASGSANFHCGILIGQGCTNIMISDLVVQGASHSDGAVHFKGTIGSPTSNVTLSNLVVSGNSTIGLKCTYCNNVKLTDVYANSNTSMGGALSALNFNNCKNVTGLRINANNNSGAANTIGLEIDACKDVTFQEIFVTNNTQSGMGGSETEGVKINNSTNVGLFNVKANNLTKTKYGISCLTSKNVILENVEISNCTVAGMGGQGLKAIYITNSQSVEINHAKIANNAIENQSFTGVFLENATNKYITLHDIHLINNSSTASEQNCTGIEVNNTEMAVISNCSISRNSSAGNLYGIKVSTNSSDIHLEQNHVIHNTSSSTGTSKIVAGIHCASINGLKIINCESVRNLGTGQAYGAYLDTVNHALISDCTMNGNAAATGINEDKPSAGLYLFKSNHCLVQNSFFINNQAGNKGTANAQDQTSNININQDVTVGAGIINAGENENNPNTGNHFLNCICNGNKTQIGTTQPSNTHFNYSGGSYRYSTNHALAAGAVNQNAKNTTFKNCTFNNNGDSNYVVSFGLLNVNTGKKTHVISCTASNNGHYGFCDHGAFTSGPGLKNAETFFMGCLALSNGTENSVAVSEQADDHKRNCRVYYSTGGTSTNPPFIQMNFDTYTQLTSEHSPFINISVKHTV